MFIHQIYLDIGGTELKDRPLWLESIEINKQLNPNSQHILWDDEKVNKFIEEEVPEYIPIIESFPHKFYLIDFIRYCILYKYGGCYIDCDVRCKKSIEEFSTICGGVVGENKINNNVIKLSKQQSYDLLQFSLSEYNRIKNNNLYSKWIGRKFLNSVSASMFARWCRRRNIVSDIEFGEYFYDEESRSWLDNQICRKDFLPNKVKYGSVNYS